MKTSFTLLIIPTFIIFAVLLVWWMATSAALKARLYNCEIGIGVVRAVATMMALFGNRSFRLTAYPLAEIPRQVTFSLAGYG